MLCWRIGTAGDPYHSLLWRQCWYQETITLHANANFWRQVWTWPKKYVGDGDSSHCLFSENLCWLCRSRQRGPLVARRSTRPYRLRSIRHCVSQPLVSRNVHLKWKIVRVRLHQASELTLRQLCDDASDTVEKHIEIHCKTLRNAVTNQKGRRRKRWRWWQIWL